MFFSFRPPEDLFGKIMEYGLHGLLAVVLLCGFVWQTADLILMLFGLP